MSFKTLSTSRLSFIWFKSTVLSAFIPGGNTSSANWLLLGEGDVSTTMRLSNEAGYVNANVIAVFAPILFANRTTLESCSSWIRWYTSEAIREKLMWGLRSLSPWFLASTVTICNRTVFNVSLVVPRQFSLLYDVIPVFNTKKLPIIKLSVM